MHRSRRFAAPTLLGIAFAVVVATTTPARSAEIAAKSWELGGDLVHTTYDNDSLISDTFSYTFRGGYAIRSRHMFELDYNIGSADQDVKDSSVSYDITRITINYIGNFKNKKPDSKFAPYALFGIGLMSIDDGDNSDGGTIFRAGGGTRYFFNKKIALRIDGVLGHFHGDGEAIPRRSYFDFDFAVGVSFFVGGS